jgi:ABC-type uncharacterized transport system substrate-binding protein
VARQRRAPTATPAAAIKGAADIQRAARPCFVQDVEIGGLMSYGVDNESQYRQAAIYVDRIRRGSRPVSLPVQGPSK